MKKILLLISTILLLALNTLASTQEIESASKPEQNFSTSKIFYYISESTAPGQFANINNWTEGLSSDPTCGEGDIKPCQITANDLNDLALKLSGRTNAQVLLITDNNRP